MTDSQRYLRVVLAFGHFAGKSLKVTDAAECVPGPVLDGAELFLRHTASWCHSQNPVKWPDLAKLARQIEAALAC